LAPELTATTAAASQLPDHFRAADGLGEVNVARARRD